MSSAYDAVIIGGGAAGCYCAIHAAARGLNIAILERSPDIGAKIRVSGGGRCNVTNLYATHENYLSENPDFCRSALARHSQWDFLDWFARAGLTWQEKHLGQIFCEQRSRGLIEALRQQLDAAGVTVITDCTVAAIKKHDGFYHLTSNQGDYRVRSCVLACGGPSFEKLGATNHALQFAKALRAPNIPFKPALVPLVIPDIPKALSGVSCKVIASAACDTHFHDDLLFTHKGLSGPAILQISSYWQKDEAIYIDFLPQMDASDFLEEKRQHPNRTLLSLLKTTLPNALADWLAAEAKETPLQHFSHAQLTEFSHRCKHWAFYPSQTEGLKKAEVCTGGISTQALNPRTLECRDQPNLYAIGEAVDVTGWLGGYNFQWAWSSAWCCAQALSKAP